MYDGLVLREGIIDCNAEGYAAGLAGWGYVYRVLILVRAESPEADFKNPMHDVVTKLVYFQLPQSRVDAIDYPSASIGCRESSSVH